MTRRERHIRILQSFGSSDNGVRFARDHQAYRKDFAAFTDEAIEQMAREVWGGFKRQQKWNAEARARKTAS